jgi:hypothetical protein
MCFDVLQVATDVSPEALMTAMDGGLHSVAIFMLQYYRSVQNYTVRLIRCAPNHPLAPPPPPYCPDAA